MINQIPTPSLQRLCSMYHLLEQLGDTGVTTISSNELGKQLGVNAPSIRKDINFLGEIGNCRGGYTVKKLKEHLSEQLSLSAARTICIVGLGRLGTAILNYERLSLSGLMIVAGFDSNINKLETIRTTVPLYPAHEITNVVKRSKIELAVLAVPAKAAPETTKRLIDGGIRGIVNFSPVVLTPAPGVFVRNIDLVAEFRIVSILSLIDRDSHD
jgi:redox-sensing transcriptional repressor